MNKNTITLVILCALFVAVAGWLGFRIGGKRQSIVNAPTINQNVSLDPFSVAVTRGGCYWTSELERHQFSARAAQLLDIARTQLPTSWEALQICPDSDVSSVYFVISSSGAKDTPQEASRAAVEATKSLFPRLSIALLTQGGSFRSYRVSVIALEAVDLVADGVTKRLSPRERLDIGQEVVWSDALAGCSLESSAGLRGGTVTVACGGGDNGCFEEERVRWKIADGQAERLGVCKKNCDVTNGQPTVLECS